MSLRCDNLHFLSTALLNIVRYMTAISTAVLYDQTILVVSYHCQKRTLKFTFAVNGCVLFAYIYLTHQNVLTI